MATASEEAVLEHYRLVAPIMEQLFGDIPIGFATFSKDGAEQFHWKYFGHYYRLAAAKMLHLVEHADAREFYSWTPLPRQDTQARFARFLLETHHAVTDDQLRLAALAARSCLAEQGAEAILILDGLADAALWVPIADGPEMHHVLAWCHDTADTITARHSDLVSQNANTTDDGRVHLHVSTNAYGRASILPYSLRYETDRVAAPIRWPELGSTDIRGIRRYDLAERLKQHGEIFNQELALIKPFHIPARIYLTTTNDSGKRVWNNAKGALLSAVVEILSDGKPRTSDEILAAGIAAKTIDPKTDARAIYIDLTQNIAREKGRGRKPLITEDADRRFRINEPLDAWLAIPSASLPDLPSATQQIIDRLHATSHGDNPTAFEVAVCDAFAALGFLANHLGGVGNPDGYIDAPLGVLGYRSMLECKSGPTMQKDQMVFEAAKYREAYGAHYCAIVGPQFGERYDIVSELQTHGVSGWSIQALEMALRIQATPLELRSLFDPGFAEDKINDVLWQRNHGEPKRIRIVAEIIRSVGWSSQVAAAEANSPATAPLLTEDAAMLVFDQALAAQGAHVNCSRDEVRAAFEWLTNPLVGAAVWSLDKTALVLTHEGKDRLSN